MDREIKHLRKEHAAGKLDENTIEKDPFLQFREWFDEALESAIIEPNAMVLATVVNDQPSARIVLLKGFDHDGFVFFTNYSSRKGHELAINPKASLLFFWDVLERQVRIEGSIERVSAQVSDEYFQSRPHGSKIGAVASPQSQPLVNREELEQKAKDIEARYPVDTEIPRPENWGGYVLKPRRIEFWQGRPNRLHDRIVYELKDKAWAIFRIAP